MSRLTNHAVRAGVSAVGVAAGLMFLASTSQTPDGFTQASFDGPLSIFGNSAPEHQGDVVAIGDGTGDTSELAAILNGPTPVGNPKAAYQQEFNAGVESPSVGVSAVPAAKPAVGASTSKQSLSLPSKSVVDAQGRVDCTGSVSCVTDSVTNVTTVTYPDGVVALVQKINDMTVVAYKTLADFMPSGIQAMLPAAPPATRQAAAQIPAATVSTNQTPAGSVVEPDPSVVPVPSQISASSVRPRIMVESTPQALAPGQSRNGNQSASITIPPVKPTSAFDVVKDVINSVVGAVTGHHPSQTKKPTDKTPSPEPTPNPETGNASDSAADSSQ